MFRTSWKVAWAFVMLLLALGGCGTEKNPSAPADAPDARVSRQTYDVIEGYIGPGSYYALYRPEPWNGDLVVVAHGYESTGSPSPPGSDEFFLGTCRDAILDLGYGVAYSSYPENGWVVKEGLIALHQLRGLYASNYGQPDETYLAGLSMGGLMVVALAETYPQQYTGVLAESGPIGGARMVLEQVFGLRALFDFYYPGVLPGTVLHTPEGTDIWAAIDAAINAMLSDPAPLLELASIEQLDLRYDGLEELITIVYWHIFFQIDMAVEIVDRIGGAPLDNWDTSYSGTSNDAAVNAGVARFHMTPSAANYLEHYYAPDGHLDIPVLTLHNTRDMIVPLGHEERYQQLVASAGCSDMLRQTTIERMDHGFTTDETISAFQELVTWCQSLHQP
jgi:pimeloyl-ACP methyl ester carboxylesterase